MNSTRPRRPAAIAQIRGGSDYPGISGFVSFYPLCDGLILSVHIHGLPCKRDERNIFALHIHEGKSCSGNDFSASGTHFDLNHTLHPYHTGDLPPLFSDHGKAYLEFWTDRFSIRDVLGRTIIIHKQPDDLHTQPSGNAGKKIACGVILRNCCR